MELSVALKYHDPLRKKGALFSNVSAATIARSWVYHKTVNMLTNEGLHKKEILNRLKSARDGEPDAPDISDITISYYLKGAVRFGLLDAAGHSQNRRYYPPGYLSSARKQNQQEAKRNESSVLNTLRARGRAAEQESGSPPSTE
jgi:hypothetical protein